MDSDQTLKLFFPGAFAHVSTVIREMFALVEPGSTISFHEFIPSGLLAREIRAGAPADLYISANTRYMQELHQEGLVKTPEVLAGNRLCIIVRRDAPAIIGLNDLVDPSIRVVVPQPETDPCGQYVAEMFSSAGIEPYMRAKYESGSLLYSRGSGDLPGFLRDGRAVAGVFYASEAKSLGTEVVSVSLPVELDFHEKITFTLGLVVRPRMHPAAEKMRTWLVGAQGQQVLSDFGFIPSAEVSLNCPWPREQ